MPLPESPVWKGRWFYASHAATVSGKARSIDSSLSASKLRSPVYIPSIIGGGLTAQIVLGVGFNHEPGDSAAVYIVPRRDLMVYLEQAILPQTPRHDPHRARPCLRRVADLV